MQVIKPGEMVNNQKTDGRVDGGHKKTRREAGLVAYIRMAELLHVRHPRDST